MRLLAASPAPVSALRSLQRNASWEAGVLAMLPLAAFFGINFKPMVQDGYLDPFIYTGYVHNFHDLIARYGMTYYAVRFGFILPAQLLATVFGPLGGYFAFRYLLALLAVVPYYALVRQWHGRTVALGVSVALITSPFLARTLLWDYTDSAGVPYVFASICLFLFQHRNRRMLDSAAGASAGLALHSNFFASVPLFIFLSTFTGLHLFSKRGVGPMMTRLAWYLVPIGIVSGLGSTYYWFAAGEWNIFSVTFGITAYLAAGGTKDFRVHGLGWVARNWAIFTPVILLLGLVLVGAIRTVVRSRYETAAVAGSAVTVAAFYVHEFLLEGNSLQLPYYFSYCLPATFLLLASLLGWVSAERRPATVAAFCVAFIVPWMLVSLDIPAVHGWTPARHLWVVVVALTLTTLSARRRYSLRMAVVCAACLGFLLWSSFSGTVYRDMVQSRVHPDDREISVYRLALAFMDAVPSALTQPGRIAFWYSNDPARVSTRSVQSTFLWGYSKLQGDGLGMPHLTADELDRLRAPDLRSLVLLGQSQPELEGARAALETNGVRFESVGWRTLKANSHTLHVEFLSLEHD